ncbi:hypothetical protein RvY_13034 [Ramazzottius varieornatus]|uniref:Transmembrane protein 19 n=1 Tax=Ramazzottius varieornatus TaxID=947166 RepID=A0A1D1VLH9_RAMVA|nr:hypothetical protein RvY_13034 [Ramazzottius varieornatus]
MQGDDGLTSVRRRQQLDNSAEQSASSKTPKDGLATKRSSDEAISRIVSDYSTAYTMAFGLPAMMLTALLFHVFVIVFRANDEPTSVVRWSLAILFPAILALHGFRRKSLSISGAVAGFVVGFIMTMGSYGFATSMFAFFILGSSATKVRAEVKRKIEADYMEGGQRTWIQVLCNGGPAVTFALFSIIENGCGEKPLDFSQFYHATFNALGVLGCLSCACGDTLASELGAVFSKNEPRLITTLQRVPRGTNGGVSKVGLWASFLGGIFIGIVFYVMTLLFAWDYIVLHESQQWPVILIAGFSGLLGSLIDSLLGALFQFSGLDKERRIVNTPGPGITKICGRELLDNHAVNLISCALTSLICPNIGLAVYQALHQLSPITNLETC